MPTEIDRYEVLAVDGGRSGHRHRREGETRQLHWWTYAGQIPTLAVLGIGPLPLLQRVILPPLVTWFVLRQFN